MQAGSGLRLTVPSIEAISRITGMPTIAQQQPSRP